MKLTEALAIARKHRLESSVRKAYRFFKPWWKFWLSEEEAAQWALTEWDLKKPSRRRRMKKTRAPDFRAHAIERRQQLEEVRELRPYWEFKADPDFCPPECVALSGTVKHWSDPFWKEHMPPCHRNPCRCQVFSFERMPTA